jgi:hypothetical protein
VNAPSPEVLLSALQQAWDSQPPLAPVDAGPSRMDDSCAG